MGVGALFAESHRPPSEVVLVLRAHVPPPLQVEQVLSL